MMDELQKTLLITAFGFDKPESGNMTGGTADCFRCEAEHKASLPQDTPLIELLYRDFIVCPRCGNKRCPRATYHGNVCTRSNESGQHGSDYGDGDVIL